MVCFKHMSVVIAIEGGEGVGKTSQCESLQEFLSERGHQATVVSEMRYGQELASITQLALENSETLSSRTRALLIAAVRAQVSVKIQQLLKEDIIVIMDRAQLSSLVYQSDLEGIDEDDVVALNAIATKGQHIDLEILLDCPVEIAAQRREARQNDDRYESASPQTHERIRQAFLKRANVKNLAIIDASQDFETISRAISDLATQRIPNLTP